jgi:hypothetical protein
MMMARVKVLHMSGILAGLMLSVAYVSRAADLIEPTRTLGGTEEPTGQLVVFSEPPGLPAALDGAGLGNTPTAIIEVKGGIHHLQVANSGTDISIQPGKTTQISLFKGSFVKIPVLEQPPLAPPEQLVAPAAIPGSPPATGGGPPSPPALSPILHRDMFGYY